ncbi:hypothetical protein ACHAXS_004846 [Conticribra weissflogii]
MTSPRSTQPLTMQTGQMRRFTTNHNRSGTDSLNLRDTSSLHIRDRRLGTSRGDEAFLPSVIILLATDLISVGLGTTLKSFIPPWMNPDLSTGPAQRLHRDASKGLSKSGGLHTNKYNNYKLHGRKGSPASIFFSSEIHPVESSERSAQEHQPTQLPNAPHIKEIRGLPNRGQTCYANSVFQALASLSPLLQYMEQLQRRSSQSREYQLNGFQQSNNITKDDVGCALHDTLSYINGHNVSDSLMTTSSSMTSKSTTPMTNGLIAALLKSIPSTASRTISKRGDPQRVMDIVAQRHSQFRSRSSLRAGLTEQQDAHEFFSALVDVLSLAGGCEQGRTPGGDYGEVNHARLFERGLASSEDILRDEKSRDLTSLWGQVHCLDRQVLSHPSMSPCVGQDFGDEEPANDRAKRHNTENAMMSEERIDPPESTNEFNEYQDEKKHDENAVDYPVQDVLKPSCKQVNSTQDRNETECKRKKDPNLRNDLVKSFDTIQNPFDGWSGSTIKCSMCHHIRPIRSTPFLGLSLPIATVQSTFLQDFLATEYGGFRQAEQVSDVQCMSCAILKKVNELEEENLLLKSAISSVQRRKRGRDRSRQCNAGWIEGENVNANDDTSIVGLVNESQQIEKKIATLKAIDPDADDDDDGDCGDSNGLCDYYNNGNNHRTLHRMIPLRCNAYKASFLIRPPTVLCIHLQRRHYDMACGRMVKVMKHVDFPEILDVSSYCAFTTNSFGQSNMNGSTYNVSRNNKNLSSTKDKISYKLMSVIEHKGNAFGGHYQTYRRTRIEDSSGGEGGLSPTEWALVSDESVTLRTWADVSMCQAYMLFYVAIS